FLWSMLVSQSRHSGPHSLNFVSRASMARPPSATPAKVATRIGSCSGMASQPSLPNSGETDPAAEDGFSIGVTVPDGRGVRGSGRAQGQAEAGARVVGGRYGR